MSKQRKRDRARSDKDLQRNLHRRQRIRAQLVALKNRAAEVVSTRVASLNMHDEGGPLRNGD